MSKLLRKLAKLVTVITNDLELQKKVVELNWRLKIFDQLRDAMRIAPIGGGNGLNDDATAEAMTSIRKGVQQFRQGLEDDHMLAADPLCRKMAKQIDKYGEKLFADSIKLSIYVVIKITETVPFLAKKLLRVDKRLHERLHGKKKASDRYQMPFNYACVSRHLSGARDDIELIL